MNVFLKIVIFVPLLLINDCSLAQTYIPAGSVSLSKAPCVFKYSHEKGANRPSAHIIFKNGCQLFLNAVCSEIDSRGISYDWCVRDSQMDDVAYLKVSFSSNKKMATIKILRNRKSAIYATCLDLLEGTFSKAGN